MPATTISPTRLPLVVAAERSFSVCLEDLESMANPVVDGPSDSAAISAAIDRIVAAAPKLSPGQHDRLSTILGGAA